MNEKVDIYKVITRFILGTSSAEDNEQLITWLNENQDNKLAYFGIKRIWLKAIENNQTIDVDESWNRLKSRTIINSRYSGTNEKDSYNLKKFFIAATILILTGVSAFLGIQFMQFSEYRKTVHEIAVPLGSRTNITLPDGTSVWLNADSKITYTSDFGVKNRKVFLTGEGYFDVHRDKKSYFIVNTRDMDIKVLGTQFNVKTYPEELITETTLVNGEVEVQLTAAGINASPVTLTSNQRLIYSKYADALIVNETEEKKYNEIIVKDQMVLPEKQSIVISKINSTEEYISWKDGRLTFRGESLATLTPKLERFFNVSITFSDESIKDIRYSGTLEEVTIEEMLRAIASASDINYEINKNHVILSH